MTCFLGIDLGTSSLKSILLDAGAGRVVATAAEEYPISTPRPGWAEQDPRTWLAAAGRTIRSVLQQSGVDPLQVTGVGLAGQMHGLACLAEDGRPLRPAILWADQRSSRQVERAVAEVGREALGRWTGNPLATGFMLPSLLWLREHEPRTFERTRWALLPKDSLRHAMTGAFPTSEPSDASATGLFDPFQGSWSEPILKAFSIPAQILPPIQPSGEIAGSLNSAFAALSGLRPGTPVVCGASDQSAQALGNGILTPGDVSCAIGTGGQVLAPLLEPRYDAALRLHLFCYARPGLWQLQAATLAAGLSLKWLRDNILGGAYSYQELADLAAQAPPGSEGLRFLPYLAGERTPWMDPAATASFSGLTLRHTHGHLARAVMEGVVFSLRQCLDLVAATGAPIDRVVASGGGARHPLWLQLQADIFGRPIYQTTTQEASALGAALLAAVGDGFFASLEEACGSVVKWKPGHVQPDPDRSRLYDEIYAQWKELYPLMRGQR